MEQFSKYGWRDEHCTAALSPNRLFYSLLDDFAVNLTAIA
jgi:hypothetical protein